MRVVIIVSFSIITLLSSCSNVELSKITFEGYSFELPGKVSDVQKSLNLEYGYYSGFNNYPVISTQIENYPVFMGSDNDSEESYYDKRIVGVTFKKNSELFTETKAILQKQYNSQFNKLSLKSWVADEYWILNTDDDLHIVLKQQLNNSDTLMEISFYKGIEDNEIENYITYDSKEYAY